MKLVDKLEKEVRNVTWIVQILETIVKGLISPCNACGVQCAKRGCVSDSCKDFVLCESKEEE